MSDKRAQYSEEKLAEFKAIITEELATIKAELDRIKTAQAEEKQRLTNTNLDFNENSKHFQHQAKNKRLIRRSQRKVSGLKGALRRIEDKTYGVCVRTGKLIREKRLKAMLTATFDIKRR